MQPDSFSLEKFWPLCQMWKRQNAFQENVLTEDECQQLCGNQVKRWDISLFAWFFCRTSVCSTPGSTPRTASSQTTASSSPLVSRSNDTFPPKDPQKINASSSRLLAIVSAALQALRPVHLPLTRWISTWDKTIIVLFRFLPFLVLLIHQLWSH